jgi:hypothetical protein
MLISTYDMVIRCSHGKQCHTTQLMTKDHHDDFTTKIIKATTLSTRKKKALILAKSHDQELQELEKLEEVLI